MNVLDCWGAGSLRSIQSVTTGLMFDKISQREQKTTRLAAWSFDPFWKPTSLNCFHSVRLDQSGPFEEKRRTGIVVRKAKIITLLPTGSSDCREIWLARFKYKKIFHLPGFFEGASPFQKMATGYCADGNVKYIPWICNLWKLSINKTALEKKKIHLVFHILTALLHSSCWLGNSKSNPAVDFTVYVIEGWLQPRLWR